MWKKISCLLCILFAGLLLSDVANASMATSVNSIIDEYQNASSGWASSLLSHATTLFWILAFIEFAWAMIGLAFRANDMGDWAATIVNQILFIGFFYWLLTNSVSISLAIVDSFKQAGAQAGGVSGIKPTDVFQIGVELVKKLLDAVSAFTPIDSLGMLIAAIVIMACFGLITAFSIVALVESYIVIYAGILLMGFGGSRWTKDYAVRTLQYAVSVGAKLYVLVLLLGIGTTIMRKWVADLAANNNIDVVLVVGFSIVMLALIKILPDLVQGLINGTSFGSGSALTAAAAAVGGAAAGVAAGAVGASMAAKGAGSLASEQLKSAQATGQGPTSTMGKAGFMASSMMKNMGSAMKEDIGGRLSGAHHGHGTMGGRMGQSMSNKADASRSSRENQSMGSNNSPSSNQGDSDNTIS